MCLDTIIAFKRSAEHYRNIKSKALACFHLSLETLSCLPETDQGTQWHAFPSDLITCGENHRGGRKDDRGSQIGAGLCYWRDEKNKNMKEKKGRQRWQWWAGDMKRIFPLSYLMSISL